MKKITKFALTLLCALTFLSTAHAEQFGGDWINIDNYSLGLSSIYGGLENVENLDSINAFGRGIVLADLSTGAFTEFIVYEATGYIESQGAGIELVDPSALNTGYELTFALQLSGTSTFGFDDDDNLTALDFSFSSLDLLNVYIDDTVNASTNDVLVPTTTPLATGSIGDYIDGTLVLTGGELVDSGSTDNVGSWEKGENGKVTTAVSLNQVAGVDFLLDAVSGDSLFDIWDLLGYNIDGDFTPAQTDLSADILTAYASLSVFAADIAEFLQDADDGNIVAFAIDYDSLVTADLGAVPEPATFALFGIGLIGLAGFARRRS